MKSYTVAFLARPPDPVDDLSSGMGKYEPSGKISAINGGKPSSG